MGKTNKRIKIEIEQPKKRFFGGKQRSEVFDDSRTKRNRTRTNKHKSAIEESQDDC